MRRPLAQPLVRSGALEASTASQGDAERPARAVALALLLVVATLLAYLPALNAGFVWDDDANISRNLPLRTLQGLWALWFEPGATTQYYPMVYTTFWIEYAIWQLDPMGYHVVNVLLHGASAVVLWRLLAFLGLPAAWFAAAVFALHPVHVESVAWITERKNLLSGLFYLSAAHAYLVFALGPGDPSGRAVRTDGARAHWLAYALALLLFVCALLSKVVTATLPAVLLLLVWWKRARLGARDLLYAIPLFALTLPIGLLTLSMEKYVGVHLGWEWTPSIVDRGLIAGRALWFYASKLAWPRDLTFVYPRWEIDASVAWQYLFPLAAAAVIIALFLARRRIGRGPVVGVLCFAGTLAPTLGVLEVYFFRFSYVADHWQYLASIGLIAVCVGASGRALALLPAPAARAGVVAGVLVLLVLGVATWRQSRVYYDAETLWRDSLAKNPDCAMAEYNLGHYLSAAGRIDEAVPHCERSIQLDPRYAEAHNNLGFALYLLGRSGEAITHYRSSLAIDASSTTAHWNLADALAEQGRIDEALEEATCA
jgi:tetratricopeptide (TPR) repeat protein